MSNSDGVDAPPAGIKMCHDGFKETKVKEE